MRAATGESSAAAGFRQAPSTVNCYVTWSKQRGVRPLEVAGAEGDEYLLADGRRIYDGISTSFQASFGHSHARIKEKIARQLQHLPMASPRMDFELKSQVSQRLIDTLRLDGGKLFYTVSGAEAVENALKIARQVTGRTVILARQRSYHGASLGAMSVSGDWRSQPHLTFDEGTLRIPEPYEDPRAELTGQLVKRQGPDSIAAAIVETISGTNGVIIPPPSWWEGLSELCRRHGILLIVDEVLCGFGRTGADFAFHHWRIQPDMICLSKAMTGGYVPLGAVWTSPPIASYYEDVVLACGLTSYAHPLGLAALDGVLETLADEGFQQRRRELEQAFAEGLQRLASLRPVVEVRCKGLLAAIDFQSAAPTAEALLDRGLYAFSKDRTLILAPPLVSSPQRVAAALDAVESAARQL